MRRLTAAELRPGSSGTLFVFAGAGGDAEEVAPLADALEGDRRIIALAPTARPGEDTIESLAVEAVALLRAAQPCGPYQLLGYSFGGLVALESARLLIDDGEKVSFVGLVDPLFDQRYWPSRLFVKAALRRAGVHLREMSHQPPAEAARELAERSRRLVRRLRGRYAVEGAMPTCPATVQDANLAVMAQFQPRSFDEHVTLFTAADADFGCDLAELWRPWISHLEVRTVAGSHVELMQTAPGVARLAAAVDTALAAPAPRLKVLVATTFRWPGAARLAVDFHEVGCAVDAIAPRGSALQRVAAVQRHHRLGLAAPVRSLRRAIESSEADLVVPCDDRTRHALGLLYAGSDPSTPAGALMRVRLERSLGAPDHHPSVYSRAALAEIARAAGVCSPPTVVVHSADEVADWFAHNSGRAVLKTDGSWGGRGVAILDSVDEGRRAWREMSRPPSYARGLKRLLVEGDPWALRARLFGQPPVLSIQPWIAGRPANAAVAAYRGAALGQVQAEVVESDGPTGPSTVVRLFEHADITFAAKSVVSHLDISGLCGLDFVIDEEGHAHLIELNPRATPTSHLVGPDGSDLLTALRTAFGHGSPIPRTAPCSDGLVALFPQELRRDPNSPYFAVAHHDVPSHAPDLVAEVSRRPSRPRARHTIGSRRRVPGGPGL